MLITIKTLLAAPLMSLQTGHPLAQFDAPIIDPRNLKIVAFFVSGPLVDFSPAVVFADDIREFGSLGAIIDSTDKILPLEDDLVRLNEVLDLGFALDNLRVVDDHKNRLGRVENYTFNPGNFQVQQLYVRPTLMRSFSVANLIVSRRQIVKIDNEKVTVRAPILREKVGEKSRKIPPAGVVENPFRKPKPAAPADENRE